VKATAAAATIRTAVAAVSTVTDVASLASSQVRRVLKAACLGGTIGIAGRGSSGMKGSPRRECARNAHVRFSEPSGLVAYSAAPARNAAMSMMKPVDNHTTSMGMMEIMGSRTGRFTRNDSVQPISVASTWNGSFLLESSEQKLRPGHGSIVKARRPTRNAVAGDVSRRRSRHSMRLRDVECAARRAESQAQAARRAWLGVSEENDLAADL
jgi:hypothetical protein